MTGVRVRFMHVGALFMVALSAHYMLHAVVHGARGGAQLKYHFLCYRVCAVRSWLTAK